MLLPPAQHIHGLENNPGVRVSRVKPPEVGTLAHLVNRPFLVVLLDDICLPTGVHLVEYVDYSLKASLGWRAIELQYAIHLGFQSYRRLKLEKMISRREDGRCPTDDVLGKIPPRNLGQDDGRERLLRPLRRSVEDEVDSLK